MNHHSVAQFILILIVAGQIYQAACGRGGIAVHKVCLAGLRIKRELSHALDGPRGGRGAPSLPMAASVEIEGPLMFGGWGSGGGRADRVHLVLLGGFWPRSDDTQTGVDVRARRGSGISRFHSGIACSTLTCRVSVVSDWTSQVLGNNYRMTYFLVMWRSSRPIDNWVIQTSTDPPCCRRRPPSFQGSSYGAWEWALVKRKCVWPCCSAWNHTAGSRARCSVDQTPPLWTRSH